MAEPKRGRWRVANLSGTTSNAGLGAMHEGIISPHSSRKIRNAVDWLVAAASQKYVYSKTTKRFHPWKLSFLTLTLPTQAGMTDIEIKSILNSFLTLAKYNYGLHSYIWKAEPQRRGDIHFHITSDCYMWKNSVRYEWNRLLAKHGLLNGHTDPPSTKIHSTYNVKNMAAYLCKYFIGQKHVDEKTGKKKLPKYKDRIEAGYHARDPNDPDQLYVDRPISGRLWGCSHSLSQARNFSYVVDTGEMRSLNYELRLHSYKEIQKDYCNFYHLKNDFYSVHAKGEIQKDFYERLLKIRRKKTRNQFEIYDFAGEMITDKQVIKKLSLHLSKKRKVLL